MSYMESPRRRTPRTSEENDERCSALAMVALIAFFNPMIDSFDSDLRSLHWPKLFG